MQEGYNLAPPRFFNHMDKVSVTSTLRFSSNSEAFASELLTNLKVLQA